MSRSAGSPRARAWCSTTSRTAPSSVAAQRAEPAGSTSGGGSQTPFWKRRFSMAAAPGERTAAAADPAAPLSQHCARPRRRHEDRGTPHGSAVASEGTGRARRSRAHPACISIARPGVGPVRSTAETAPGPSSLAAIRRILPRQQQRVGENHRIVDDQAGGHEHQPAPAQLVPAAGERQGRGDREQRRNDRQPPRPGRPGQRPVTTVTQTIHVSTVAVR